MKTNSNLERVLEAGKFAVTAELGPPKSADPKVIRNKAKLLKGYADAFNVTDGQTAVVRMASWAACVLQKEEGLEPVVQMTCRDRNRIALQMDVLGAAALGINNILVLSGDHMSFGNHPQAKGVYDIDSIQFIKIIKDLRDEKVVQSGEEIDVEPRMFIGAAANPFAEPFDIRPYRLAKKVAAGADFIQTQMVYNVPKFRDYMARVHDMGLDEQVYILAGVGPIRSLGAARYMASKVPGMDVPDEIVNRMKKTPKEDRAAEGIKICTEIIEQVREIPGVKGVHVMAIEWEDAVPEIVKTVGLR
ncbi:MAG: methylenetetrahydrofolate reductase [Candidatus Bipolaricaulota bacterium]|nr:methylenetetrahydrofolate reductase [Candidatus Bipolaricaulota bacterium]